MCDIFEKRETKEALPSEEVAEEHWFAPSPPEVEPSSFSTAIGQSLEKHSPTLSRKRGDFLFYQVFWLQWKRILPSN